MQAHPKTTSLLTRYHRWLHLLWIILPEIDFYKILIGEWIVYESTDPVSRKTPICDYLKRTRENHVAIRRLVNKPNKAQLDTLFTYLKENMGKEYNFGFNYDSKKLFCSKLVYLAFKKAFNIEIGDVKTLKKLLAENPTGSTFFWRLYFFGFIPWERRTVTPKDQLLDKDLATVWTWEKSDKPVL